MAETLFTDQAEISMVSENEKAKINWIIPANANW
jgi:hypothetical protein